ncbi:hypothetical protein Tco_0481057 [Tanacetum coccineum]
MVPATAPLIGFNGEIIWPIGQISLSIKIGDTEHSTSTWMNFVVVISPYPYNGIIGRPRVRKIQAVPSTAHEMTESTRVAKERIKMAIHPEYPEQTIAISSTLTEDERKELCALFRRNLDIFAWKPTAMTRVPRHIAEHWLNVREGCPLVRQKKRSQAPERNKEIHEEVERLVEADIMKEVHYHSWLANPAMVKKHDNSWRMCVDFKELNKTCPKDGYPLPEIDWKIVLIRARITSITVNGKNAYELKGKFLDDLHKNAFSGTNGEDAVEHIEYLLRIVDPIDLPNVNQDKLRVVVLPISLVGDA